MAHFFKKNSQIVYLLQSDEEVISLGGSKFS